MLLIKWSFKFYDIVLKILNLPFTYMYSWMWYLNTISDRFSIASYPSVPAFFHERAADASSLGSEGGEEALSVYADSTTTKGKEMVSHWQTL